MHKKIISGSPSKKKKNLVVPVWIAGALVASCRASWCLPCAQLDWDMCVRSQIGEDFALGGICLLVPMLARLVNYLICSTTSGAHEFQMSDVEILA